MLLGRKQAQAVLDDDDCAVDDDAEIDRAQAHEVGADLVFEHSSDSEKHRERDDKGRRDSRFEVSQD